MKTEAVEPARIERDADGTPFSPAYGDVYHPAAGAGVQARHVFLAGNGLPERWQRRERFVMLETGFGLGNNFLATWDAWRRDPAACERLRFISVERHPPSREDLRAVPRDSALAPLAQALADAWPPLTPNLHRLDFDGGRVQLLLALGDVAAWLPELVARVDAFYLDGFAPARNPAMWQPRLFKAMARLAAPGATLATWTAARSVRDSLAAAGFEVRSAPGTGGKRDITLGRFAPAFTPRSAPARQASPPAGTRRAVIVGAGLAGCAAAWALAEQGWDSLLLDRRSGPALEASGNPGGLFHGVVHRQDGTHARFNRAAALHAAHAVRHAIEGHGAQGAVQGLLRLETSGAPAAALRATLAALGLPADYVRAVDAEEATRLAGLPLQHPAWFYPDGGWVDPAALAHSYLQRAGQRSRFDGDTLVDTLRRHDGRWQLLDPSGVVVAEAEAVVLANAGDALRLLAPVAWPVQKVRGQVSVAAADAFALPRIPVAGAGYLLPAVAGQAVFGATSQAGDDDAAVRDADHVHNLDQLASLLGAAPDVSPEELSGRVGWRWVCDDRLPLIGAVPDAAGLSRTARLDQPRLVPRVAGLYLFTALGSRGITWSALGAQLLASWVTGGPSPVEASLLDALDPARFIARGARRAAAPG
jgi:tRNA 5-methylaminomethyl-2-thiouridine biosynthesis bifunctional protein